MEPADEEICRELPQVIVCANHKSMPPSSRATRQIEVLPLHSWNWPNVQLGLDRVAMSLASDHPDIIEPGALLNLIPPHPEFRSGAGPAAVSQDQHSQTLVWIAH